MLKDVLYAKKGVDIMNRLYIIGEHLELNRKEFEDFLIAFINEYQLFNLRNLTGVTIERSVQHHPLRIAREIGFRVETYLR